MRRHKIYPNPFENALHIEGIEGPLDHRNEILNGDVQMDLPSGIYLVNIQQEESDLSFTAKLIRR